MDRGVWNSTPSQLLKNTPLADDNSGFWTFEPPSGRQFCSRNRSTFRENRTFHANQMWSRNIFLNSPLWKKNIQYLLRKPYEIINYNISLQCYRDDTNFSFCKVLTKVNLIELVNICSFETNLNMKCHYWNQNWSNWRPTFRLVLKKMSPQRSSTIRTTSSKNPLWSLKLG